MKDLKRLIPGALISVAIIGAILYFVDFDILLKALQGVDYRILVVSMILSFVWMFVRAKAWKTLLRDRATYKNVLFTTGEGYLLNNFLPFRLGELGRAFLLSRKSELQFGEIIPTIVIERIVDLAFAAVILLSAIPFLPFVSDIAGSQRIGYVVGAVVVIGLVMMYILARNNQWALDLFHKLSARWPAVQRIGGSFLEAFFTGLGALTDGWLFVRFMFWMTLDWAIALLAYFLIIRAYFPDAQLGWALFGLGAAAFGGAIPSLPGGVGTFEGAIVGALALFAPDQQSTALAAALTMRFYNYLNATVIGVIGLMNEGQTLSGIYQDISNFRKKAE